MYKNLLFIVFSLFAINSFGQTGSIPKPEFMDLPYVWYKGTNELVPLSKETANIKMGIKASYKFSGQSSATKISSEKDFSFLINSTMSGNAALMPFKLYKLDVNKKNRQVAIMSAGVMKANSNNKDLIDFNSKKVGDDLYEFVLSNKLEKGEYVFTNSSVYYTFSVE